MPLDNLIRIAIILIVLLLVRHSYITMGALFLARNLGISSVLIIITYLLGDILIVGLIYLALYRFFGKVAQRWPSVARRVTVCQEESQTLLRKAGVFTGLAVFSFLSPSIYLTAIVSALLKTGVLRSIVAVTLGDFPYIIFYLLIVEYGLVLWEKRADYLGVLGLLGLFLLIVSLRGLNTSFRKLMDFPQKNDS